MKNRNKKLFTMFSMVSFTTHRQIDNLKLNTNESDLYANIVTE